MEIVKITEENIHEAAAFTADFRVTLKGYKGITSRPDTWCAGWMNLACGWKHCM